MIVTFLDILIAGLLMGGIYALIAVGLSLQYGVARVLNISHGEFIMIGAFVTWMLYTSGTTDDGAGNGHALALAAAELARVMVRSVREAHTFEGLTGQRAPFRGTDATVEQAVGHVVLSAHAFEQEELLEDETDMLAA